MEVVAAIASVAGILSLLGESLDGTRKLRDFFSDFSSASTTIAKILHDIQSLDRAISNIKNLVKKLPLDFKGTLHGSLQVQLEDYMKDVCRWLNTAKMLSPASATGMKLWLKKLRIAVNIKSVNEIKLELGRHQQAFNLSLSILGREMDVSTATNVKDLEGKVSQGTAASLSKIEKQDSMLQRIEAFSQSGMQSSAASVRSLDSIATSLSRLEAMASSTDNVPSLCRRCSTEDTSIEISTKRSSSEYRSRRSSAGSAIANKSAWISRKNSAAAMGPLAIQEEPRPLGSLVFSETYGNSSYTSNAERKQTRLQKRNSDPVGSASSQCDLVRESDELYLSSFIELNGEQANNVQSWAISSEAERWCPGNWNTQHLWKVLSEQQPESVLAYIALVRKARILQNRINALYLLDLGCATYSAPNENVDAQRDERAAMQSRLDYFLSALRAARIRCILEGHSLYEIDNRLCPPINNDGPNRFWDRHNGPEENQARNRYLVEMCEGGNQRSVYGEAWSDKRDRINHWMLHCLRSDEAQAQLHQSMLAVPPQDDECWATQVLSNWFVDGAAVDRLQEMAHSTGAVDSREAPASDPGPLEVERNEGIDEATILRSGVLSF